MRKRADANGLGVSGGSLSVRGDSITARGALMEISIILKGFATTSFEILLSSASFASPLSPALGGLRGFSFES
jgi:hypothetical protein